MIVAATGRAHGPDRIVFTMLTPSTLRCAARRSTARGSIDITLERPARPGVRPWLVRMALEQLDALEAIDETLAQVWPRCDGLTPSAATDWHAEGFGAAEVGTWLKAGVPFVGAAVELASVGVEPSDVAGEHAGGLSIGCAFARGVLRLDQVRGRHA